jgi:hypothetical protein
MQQSSMTLRYSLENVLNSADNFRRHLKDIKNLFEASKVSNILQDGQNPYPNPSIEKHQGMGFEFK